LFVNRKKGLDMETDGTRLEYDIMIAAHAEALGVSHKQCGHQEPEDRWIEGRTRCSVFGESFE
jgi:hypothetical protein